MMMTSERRRGGGVRLDQSACASELTSHCATWAARCWNAWQTDAHQHSWVTV